MENHNGASGRKRGPTKHSVEDQALDQIAKEKIVNFGSGRTSNESSGEEGASRPVTPVMTRSEVEEKVVHQVKKKRGRSRKRKKSGGKKENVILQKDDDDNDENCDDDQLEDAAQGLSLQHVVPDIFFEDLSETDKSKEESSTSHDVSSSDLSESLPAEVPGQDIDIWADRDDDDFVVRKRSVDEKEQSAEMPVNFEDFWAEFDEIDGKPKKRSDTDGGNSGTSVIIGGNSENEEKMGCGKDVLPLESKDRMSSVNDVEDFWAGRDDDVLAVRTPVKLVEEKNVDLKLNDTLRSEDVSGQLERELSESTEISSIEKSWNQDIGKFQSLEEKDDCARRKTSKCIGASQMVISEKVMTVDHDIDEKSHELIETSISNFGSYEYKNNVITGSLQSSPSGSDDNAEDLTANEKSNIDSHTGRETSESQIQESTENSQGSESEAEESKEESSHPKKSPWDEEKIEKDQEEEVETKQTDWEVKEVHQRNFAKVLQDIKAPGRRRSVLLPDTRERVVGEVPASRSELASESSTDGEVANDDDDDDDGIIDFLGKENDRAEARLAARRQARVEAREIRMRELERLQKEQEETNDKVFDLHTTPPHLGTSRQPSMSPRERPTSTNSYHSSRRSSEDSMEDGLSLRDLRHELKEVEEKFRKAMIANAQLDNEKAAHAYQVELLKDKLEDLEELHSQLGREHRERCREHEALKRAALKLKEELAVCKMYLEERDRLIADYGLVIVGGEIDEKGEATPRTLVSNQAAQVLESAGEGSLDVRLKNLAKEKNDLADEVRHLKLELEEERSKRRSEQVTSNGPIGDEIQQTLSDYRFRLQKAEQDTSTLQATVALLESQVIRYKSAAEESEKAEDELKQEKRKLLREHRESIARIEELETSNSHLQRRMDKLKNAKSTLLKEL